MSKPQPEQYATRAEFRWAVKLWRRRYGGWTSVFGSVVIALVVAGLTGSVAFAFVALVVMLAWPIVQGAMREQK